jgi:hypothetical protein
MESRTCDCFGAQRCSAPTASPSTAPDAVPESPVPTDHAVASVGRWRVLHRYLEERDALGLLVDLHESGSEVDGSLGVLATAERTPVACVPGMAVVSADILSRADDGRWRKERLHYATHAGRSPSQSDGNAHSGGSWRATPTTSRAGDCSSTHACARCGTSPTRGCERCAPPADAAVSRTGDSPGSVEPAASRRAGLAPTQVILKLADEHRQPFHTRRFAGRLSAAGVEPPDRDRRRTLNALSRRRFVVAASALESALQTLGAEIEPLAELNMIRVTLPRASVAHLSGLPGVADVFVSAPSTAGRVDDDFTCAGLPDRWIAGTDGLTERCCNPDGDVFNSVCQPPCGIGTYFACATQGMSNHNMFLDSVRDVMGAGPYWSQGYHGAVAGGATDEEALVVGVIDLGFVLGHPGWRAASGDHRARFVASQEWPSPCGGGTQRRRDPTTSLLDFEFSSHGARTAGIIGADVRRGQDPQSLATSALTEEEGRLARTGLAPEVLFQLYELDVAGYNWHGLSTEDAIAAVGDADAIVDIVNMSASIYDFEDYTSATAARGRSGAAEMVNTLFRDFGVLFVKSAGNISPAFDREAALAATPDLEEDELGWNLGGPAASCVLSVGALDTVRPPAYSQVATSLTGASGADRTPDGRTWPSLVVPAANCGTMAGIDLCEFLDCSSPPSTYCGASVFEDGAAVWVDGASFGLWPSQYGQHGATSGAAPKVAGAAALLKEWYLREFGENGNEPGRLMACLLNMTDRYVNAEQLQPYPGWGLGRFRLRNWLQLSRTVGGFGGGLDGDGPFASDAKGSKETRAGFFGCWRVTLYAGSYVDLDLNLPVSGVVSANVSRLHAVAWWDEPDTGEGQAKPTVSLTLLRDGRTEDEASSTNADGGEQVVSLVFDNASARAPCLAGGVPMMLRVTLTQLVLPFRDVGSYVAGRVGNIRLPDTRSVSRELYVCCAWETGADSSLASCIPDETDGCASRVPNSQRVAWG